MAKSVAFWFRKKYSLPPNDPRFLSMTVEDMATEYWAYQYEANPNQEEIEDEDFDIESILADFEREAGDGDEWEEVDLSDN